MVPVEKVEPKNESMEMPKESDPAMIRTPIEDKEPV